MKWMWALLLVACGEPSGSSAPPDADVPRDALVAGDGPSLPPIPDMGQPDAGGAPRLGFGEPCEGNRECASGWCLPDGVGRVCTKTCLEDAECPDEWACLGVGNTRPDVVFVCAPPLGRLCGVCSGDEDCPGGRCVTFDGVPVCGLGCETGCPDGTVCTDVDGVEQCLPGSGSCTCDAGRAGETRACGVFGCVGHQTCLGDEGWGGCDAPAAVAEACNGLDDDCDGEVDETFDDLFTPCSVGEGGCRRNGVRVCAADGLGTTCGARAAEPVAEACDGLDDDCDGEIDEGLEPPACPLSEGVCAGATSFCAGHAGWLECGPGTYGVDHQVEETRCDGLDNDCDGEVDEVDLDGDGERPVACGGTDCDDADPEVNVAAVEVCGDGIDNDCDGSADNLDLDGDRVLAEACGGTDCDDAEASVHPGALEVCDALDNDCNGAVDDKDADADGHVDAECVAFAGALPVDDCDDGNLGVHPGREEVCGNAFDEDCSGEIDDKDVDRDGAVDADPVCGGDDCDDRHPLVHPGAPEVRDGRDNDCDADGLADEGRIAAGAVVITELLYDASATPDENYEWFEVFNPGDRPVDLNGWLLHDAPGAAQELALVNLSVVVPPRSFAVLCRTGAAELNGGVRCDYEYGYLQLANTADELVLQYGEVEVDAVRYDERGGWPAATGASLTLSPESFDGDNGVPRAWCEHPPGRPLPSGDDASPGVSNVACVGSSDAPQITAVHPANGLASGGDVVRLVGAGFEGTTAVRVGGVDCAAFQVPSDHEIRCVLPARPPGRVDIEVVEGVSRDTLVGRLVLTEAAVAPAASLVGPSSASFLRGTWTETLRARAAQAGVTGGACPDDRELPALRAEAGIGPAGSDPARRGGWVWFPAFCERPDGEGTVFRGTVTAATPGEYAGAFRFSLDGGASWRYVDELVALTAR